MSRAKHGRGTSPYRDEDSYDDDNYSEDFEDEEAQSNRRYKTKSPLLRTASATEHKKKAQRPKDSRHSDSNIHSLSVYRSDRSNRSRGRGGKGGRMTGRSSQEPKFDNIAKRVMSARRLKINELLNTNRELQLQIQDMKDENKLLKKTHFRQDKALKRFEEQESDLPQLIQRQNNESRALKEQIRKWREKFEKTDRYLRDAEDELEKVKSKMKKLKMLADEKDLPERGELNKKINKAELDMEEKDVRIRELERHVQNLEKNHRHELGIERARQRDVNKQLQGLRDQNEKLSTDVKERDKELQMKNIYANRMVKPPHRLPNSYSGTPHGTPPPARKRRQSLNEADGITPRERAKQMEEKRREELRRHRELKQKNRKPTQPASHSTVHHSPRRMRDPSPLVTRERSQSRDRSRAITPKYRDDTHNTYLTPRGQQQEKLKREQELRSMREREERENEEKERNKREEQERREWEDKERRMNEEARREEDERRNREERERLKRESDHKRRDEQDRKEREERLRREKREKEERERRERERLEQERRAQEERQRFEDDVSLQAERRKKDEILQKLRDIDEGVPKAKEKNSAFNDPFFVTQDKEMSSESMGSRKSYKFTKPIENLHKGKPAKEKGRDRSVDDITTGGYNPTVSSTRGGGSKSNNTAPKTFSLFDDDEPKVSNKAGTKPAQKSRLMEELFGSKADAGQNHDDIFAPSKPAPKKNTQGESKATGFPWEDSTSVKTSSLNTKRENSSTLFGGGNALINDDDFGAGNKKSGFTPVRRPKQATTTFHNRPTVNAVDPFDDDIEEVML